MNLASIIIGSIILSLLSSTAYFSTTSIYSMIEEKKNMITFDGVQDAIVEYYDETGDVPLALTDMNYYIETAGTIDQLKDTFGNPYQIIRRSVSGIPISYNNLSDIRAIVVSVGVNGVLDSTLNNNTYVPAKNEPFVIVNDQILSKGKRGNTKNKLTICNTSVKNYINVIGATPNTIYDLVANNYLLGVDLIDGWGEALKLTTNKNSCYSFGPNMIDDAGGGDDIL